MRKFAWIAICIVLGGGICLPSEAEAARYQKSIDNIGCGFGGNCSVTFPVVPAGKTLVINNVSCHVRVKTTVFLNGLFLIQVLPGGGNGLVMSLGISDGVFNPSPEERMYQSNDAVNVFATQGQRFRATAFTRSGEASILACHISGDLN